MTNIRFIDDYELTTEDLVLSDWDNYDFIRNAIFDKMGYLSTTGYEWTIGTESHEYKITTEAEDFEEDLKAFDLYKDGELLGRGFSLEDLARITEQPEA